MHFPICQSNLIISNAVISVSTTEAENECSYILIQSVSHLNNNEGVSATEKDLGDLSVQMLLHNTVGNP